MAITYETLFELLRKEKNHEDLQKIDDNFISELIKYVEEKNKSLEKPRLDQFMEGYENEQNAIRIQIHNIKKIVRELFERRERKIIDMAVNRAKTSSNIIDTNALLPEEKAFFEEQTNIISSFRGRVIEAALTPNYVSKIEKIEEKTEPKELNTAPMDSNIFKKIHILEDTPQFVGVDLEIYGPYNTNEQIELKSEIADMLIATNKAKVI